MNALMNAPAMMSSREIAELTGKEHKNILRDCDKLNEDYAEMRLAQIGADLYEDSYGRDQKCYQLSRMQTFDLMTGYDTKLRIKVNRRWEELETVSRSVPAAVLSALTNELSELRVLIQKGRGSAIAPPAKAVLAPHLEAHIHRFWDAMAEYPQTMGVIWSMDLEYLYIRMSLALPFYEAYCTAHHLVALSSHELIKLMRSCLYAPYVPNTQMSGKHSYFKAGFGRCFRFRYVQNGADVLVGGVKLL